MASEADRFYEPGVGYAISGIEGLVDETPAVQWFDDFLGDVLADQYAVDQSTGTCALNIQQGGVVRLSVIADNDKITLAMDLNIKLNTAGFLEVRLKQVGAATLRAVEVGLSDAKSETAGLAFSDVSVPTAVATDAVMFAYDTDVDTSWYAASVNNGTAVSTELVGRTPSTSWQKLRLEWTAGGAVEFYIDGDLVAKHESAARTTIALTPWISMVTRSEAIKIMDIDYLWWAADRE